ncbi:MAG: hypothetical protein HY841_12155 [Bacteroidetes bacterium]|nr:hypothetical protein [Bacteroidota bacterium]
MAENNFFKLDLTNKWANDFCNDHDATRELYRTGYELLKNSPMADENENKLSFEENIKYFAKISTHSVKFNEAYIDLLISYSAFQAQAEKDENTLKEFKKLPEKFSDVSDTLCTLNDAFTKYFESLKDII